MLTLCLMAVRRFVNRVVWGDLSGLSIVPTSMSWSNLERANGELMVK